MALIEYLEHDDWREALRRSFEGAITLLQRDRFRMTSSAFVAQCLRQAARAAARLPLMMSEAG